MTTDDVMKAEALRHRAQHRLAGPAPPSSPPRGAAIALGVLHDLAASPASAADALALLHELQVHQVELTLQDEDLRASVAELEAALARHQQRDEFAPVALFSVDHRQILVELNRAGVRLLACPREAALDRTFTDLFQAEDRPRLRSLFAARQVNTPPEHVRVRLLAADGSLRVVQVSAAADPLLQDGYRVAVTPIGEPGA